MSTKENPTKLWSARFRQDLWHSTRSGWSALLLWLFFSFPFNLGHAQTPKATVTFYTGGTVLGSITPGSKHGVFSGFVFDNGALLFLFRGHGFEKNQHRFVTVEVSPGIHDFSASQNKNDSSAAHVQLSVVPGQHYFLRADYAIYGAVIVSWVKPLLTESSCADAHTQLEPVRPLTPKRVGTGVVVASDTTIPACESGGSQPAHKEP